MKKLYFFGLLAAIIMSSCAGLRLLPAPNASVVVAVTHLQNSFQSLYDNQISSSDKHYASHSADYDRVNAEVANLVSMETARVKNKNLLKQAQNIQELFHQYLEDHKARDVLPDTKFKVYRDYLLDATDPLLKSELSIK